MIVGIAVASMAVILAGVYQDAYDDMLDNKVPLAMMGGQYEYGFMDFQSENNYGDMVSWTYLSGWTALTACSI